MIRLSRRELLKRSSVGAAALAAARVTGVGAVGGAVLRAQPAGAAAPFTAVLPIPTVLTGADITLRAAPADVQILDGAPTRMWTFNGTFPGPTIRRPAGEQTRVTVVHDLPEEAESLTIHHHGSHTASVHDGLPEREVIEPGAQRTYVYDHTEDGESERAALQWYHDHSHHRTSFNSWMGLAGLFILDDDFEAGLPLPRGVYELPLFLTDRTFDDNNQLVTSLFDTPAGSREVGGTTYLVNGAVQPHADVEPRRYRLRVHNGSGFRLYNLKLAETSSSVPADAAAAPALAFQQIGTEAGLLSETVDDRSDVLLGPAERADLVVDFSALAGKSVVLAAVARPARLEGSPRQPPADPSTPAVFMEFRVGQTVTEPDPGPLPATLRPLPAWTANVKQTPDRVFAFGRGVEPDTSTTPPRAPYVWTVNGRPFDHTRVDARPELGSTETWLLLNTTDKTHYIHLHDVDWLVVSRNGAGPEPYEAGLKETFRLDPGEFVTVASKFTDHLGAYMIHCHMLDHEDGGMMTTFEVVAPGAGTPTTLTADERVRTDSILRQMRRNPGAPAPLPLLRALERNVTVGQDGSPYRCDLT